MNINKYGEVINSKDTYFEIAKQLIKGESVGIGWTDEYSTHFDIIFTLGINKYGLFRLPEPNEEVEDSFLSNDLFIQILNDENNFVISKFPYIPANGEGFYYIGADLKPGYCPTMNSIYSNFGRQMRQMLIAMGNCYKTEQDARDDRKKWCEVFNKDEKFFEEEF